ncbi:hypothetical protein YZ31_07120 [Campylobacter lari]|nr:hypothetical protein [Campylobacter lari]
MEIVKSNTENKIIIIAKQGEILIYKDPEVAKDELKNYLDENANLEWTDLTHEDINNFINNLNETEESIEIMIDDNCDISPVLITGRTYSFN